MEHHIALARILRRQGDLIKIDCCCGFTETIPAQTPINISSCLALGYGIDWAIRAAVDLAMAADADVWGEMIAAHLVTDANLSEVMAAWSRPE